MKYCPRCGVVLAEEAVRCDLCGAAAIAEKPAAAEAGIPAYPPPDGILPGAGDAEVALTGSERRRVFLELISVAFAVALVVTVLVDLFVEHGLTWSRYSTVCILIAYALTAAPILWFRRPLRLLSALAPALALLVFLLDIINGRIDWYFGYALPMLALLAADAVAVGLIIRWQRRIGLNIVAVVLGGISAFCFGVESVLDLNNLGRLSPDWSVVVGFALVPTAAFLFYLHYRIVHRASLRKLFRL